MKPGIRQEVREELAFHVEMRVRELVAAGMSPAAAREEAVRRLGGLEDMQTQLTQLGLDRDRDIRRRHYFRELAQDLRYGVRQLGRQRGFALVAVLTLALAIGATTAIFSVIHATLLRPLPYGDPDRIVRLRDASARFDEFSVSAGHAREWQRRTRVFDALATYQLTFLTLTGGPEPQRLGAVRSTPELPAVLQIQPAAGRWLQPSEMAQGRDDVAVVSHGFWQREFGGRGDAVGQSIVLNGRPKTIVGIMPRGFAFPSDEVDVWTPLALSEDEWRNHGSHYLSVVARARPGVTIDAVREDMARISRELAEEFPRDNKDWFAKAWWLQDYQTRDVRSALWLLAGAVAFVLLIACANVASLLLARGASRQRELAVRAAIGAGRWRLVRQLLTEGMVLAVAGGALGLLLAHWLLQALLSIAPESLPRASQIGLDGTALAFALAVSVLSPLLFALLPSWQVSSGNLSAVMGHGGRSSASAMARGTRAALIVGEVALAFVVLAGAALLLRSFAALVRVDPGFETSQSMVVRLSLPAATYDTFAKRAGFFDELTRRLAATPGITQAAVSPAVPFFSDMVATAVPEGTTFEPADRPSANFYAVSPGYFETMGIPVLRGRAFTHADSADSRRVAIISESLARTLFADADPIGRRIRVGQGPGEDFSEIVGIAGNVKQYSLNAAESMLDVQMYEPAAQHAYFPVMYLVVRGEGDPAELLAPTRAVLRGLDPDLPMANPRTYQEEVDASLGSNRFTVRLLGIFAIVALTLAIVGLYGLLSYAVSQRTQEIGVRMAHGAGRRDIFTLLLGHGLRLALAGVAIGVAGALWLSRLLESLLYAVAPRDPLSFATAGALLIAVAALASAVPARRATRVDPIVALRS